MISYWFFLVDKIWYANELYEPIDKFTTKDLAHKIKKKKLIDVSKTNYGKSKSQLIVF